jgi:uncharacterized lipoprotein YmbA
MTKKCRVPSLECRVLSRWLLGTRHSPLFFGLAALAVVLTGGCSFFSRTKNQIYSLDRVPGLVANIGGVPIGIDSVELPPGFDRKEIVVRNANNQLEMRGTQQWSATLGQSVLHALAFDLADRLPAGMVILPGAAKPSGMRSIDVVFEEIAAGPDAKVVIDARWGTHHEHIEAPITSLDSANVASGMSQALATLADRIVAQLSAP